MKIFFNRKLLRKTWVLWKRIKKAESFVLPYFLRKFLTILFLNVLCLTGRCNSSGIILGIFFSFLILPPENVVAESKSKFIKVVAKSINKLWFDRQSFPVVGFFLFELVTLSATVVPRIVRENSSPPRLSWRSIVKSRKLLHLTW